jgi:hypothetical protein
MVCEHRNIKRAHRMPGEGGLSVFWSNMTLQFLRFRQFSEYFHSP